MLTTARTSGACLNRLSDFLSECKIETQLHTVHAEQWCMMLMKEVTFYRVTAMKPTIPKPQMSSFCLSCCKRFQPFCKLPPVIIQPHALQNLSDLLKIKYTIYKVFKGMPANPDIKNNLVFIVFLNKSFQWTNHSCSLLFNDSFLNELKTSCLWRN